MKILKDICWIRKLAQDLDHQNKGLAVDCFDLQMKQFVVESEHSNLSKFFNKKSLSKSNADISHEKQTERFNRKRVYFSRTS